MSSQTSPTEVLSPLTQPVAFPEAEKDLTALLTEFRNVLALPGEPLGITDIVEHSTQLMAGGRLCYMPTYKMPHSKCELVNRLIVDMLEQDIIAPSTSSTNFKFLLKPLNP